LVQNSKAGTVHPVLGLAVQREQESEHERAIRSFHEGKYGDAIALAKVIDANLGKFSVEEQWPIFVIKCQMATGDYPEALNSLEVALERFPSSIRLRWIGVDVCRFNNDTERADELFTEIGELVSRSSWKYRDKPNQIVLGKYFLSRKADAKEVLDSFFTPVKNRNPDDPNIFRAIGDLALSKHDFGLAAENFSRVIELAPTDSDAYSKLAESYLPSDSEKANDAINKALAINPNHVDSLLIVVDQHISSENYDEAKVVLGKVLKTNPRHPDAWAYRAVIAHLENDPIQEGEYRNKSLADWPGNPRVDHLIGRELSEKYRFQEGEKYQRRSLVYDKDYLPAKMQLAHDLLRLGQELEGWKLADEVFDADQYSVVAHNLVTLRDQISKFKTLERDGFVVRMDAHEADIYGTRVLDLLSRSKQVLGKKYQAELETPIFVEIFPRQQDFAIRTFGWRGGAGFLGVCFGRVITMNSPAAQGSNLTSWESVLWHEFCHVVTLQKTKNKMPRWLSEGISVYEETLADPAWGEAMNLQYREMMLGDDLTPVSQLSGAFLRPASPIHLQFAYYESSLVVEYLVKEFGMPSLIKVLEELSIGTPINDALRRHVAPVEFIDKKFSEFAKSRAESFAPNANWEDVDPPPESDAEALAKWNSEHADNFKGLLAESQAWLDEGKWSRAIKPLENVIRLGPGAKQAYVLLAKAQRELGESEKELESLERLAKLDADNVELFTRLLEITTANGDWDKSKSYARKLLALNPLLTAPHRYLALAAEKTDDDQAIIESLDVLSNMNPLDAADVHFRLAAALQRTDQLAAAKRQVILALEQAPRYRDAHALLLKIVTQQSEDPDRLSRGSDAPTSNRSASDPAKESP
jgi:tetratricopeptide (TPR) repeat protein